MKQSLKNFFFLLFIMTSVFICVRFPAEMGEAVSRGMERCLGVIIPSMFVFMCLTTAAAESGLHIIISLPFKPVSRRLFRLRPDLFGIFILSMFSGYPAGIKLLRDLFAKGSITKKEFDRMCCFCYAGGPAFISGVVSGVIYPRTPAGTVCFISVTAANIACGLLSGLFLPVPPKTALCTGVNTGSHIFIDSAVSSAKAMFRMCVMITAFSGVFKAAELSGLTGLISGLITKITGLGVDCSDALVLSFFEISNIVDMPGSISLLPVIAALLSFGGVCVVIQSIAVAEGLLNVKRFLAGRFFAALLSAFICRLISRFFDFGTVSVYSASVFRGGNEMLPSLLLLIMTAMLISASSDA